MMNSRRRKNTSWSGLALGIMTIGILHAEPSTAQSLPRSPDKAAAKSSELKAQEEQMLSLAKAFARRCAEAINGWLDAEEVTEAKLFSFLYYPVEGTNPAKFTTDWDRLADRDIRPISDDVLSKSGAISFAVLVDRNGYLPAHNQRYSLPLTGNPAVDLVGNRTKRIFADRTGFAAARNNRPFLIQRYTRDTGEIMEDLSVPIRIRGKKWGSVRIGYRVAEID